MSIRLNAFVLGLLLGCGVSAQDQAPRHARRKQEAVAAVERQRAPMVRMSDDVWRFAETALREHRSAKTLADYAEQQGFRVERGVAEMPTAFMASYGEGRPVIGILGEYDALPGISQKAVPQKEALQAGAPGHGCGHNLFGAASLGAAVAIKEMIAAGKLKGTVRYYGTPAEESIGGKIYMLRAGLIKDSDVVLVWHPSDRTLVDIEGAQANVQFFVEFNGKTAHAAADPWNGRSAVDAMELFTHGVNMLREHVKPTVRMHYALQRGGDVPNVVADYARVWMWVRDSKRAGAEEVYGRVQEIARGAAMMAGVESKVILQSGYSDMNFNVTGLKLMQANLEWLGAISYSAEEEEFARTLQRVTGKEEKGIVSAVEPWKDPLPDPPGGSTDVGDVSWNVPTLHFYLATTPRGIPWHAWPVVASGGMSIGHKGMMQAAKALAATAVDLFEDAALREAIRKEFAEKTKGHEYKPYIPAGPPPVPKD